VVSIKDSCKPAQTGKPEHLSGLHRETKSWIASRFSRLFIPARQRDDLWMLELLIQFIIELARALLVDALSGHIRSRVGGFWRVRMTGGTHAAIRHVHSRNRKRLLHRLRTEEK
jgi:hypothetical protein